MIYFTFLHSLFLLFCIMLCTLNMYINLFLALVLSIIAEVIISSIESKKNSLFPANVLNTRFIKIVVLSVMLFFINTSLIEFITKGRYILSVNNTYYQCISIGLMPLLTEKFLVEIQKTIYLAKNKKTN